MTEFNDFHDIEDMLYCDALTVTEPNGRWVLEKE